MEIKSNEKIRVRLESFNHELLNTSCEKIMEITQNNNVDNVGVVSLPTDKRILDIYYDSSVNVFDLLVKSDLPPGVLYRICLL